jgi:hypothetical protein
MRSAVLVAMCLAVGSLVPRSTRADEGSPPPSTRSTPAADRGRFLRLWWFEQGIEHGNPVANRRFRVNSPEAALDPQFASRSEVRGNGMLQILMEEDLRKLAGTELALELWGGHPGTARRRVTPNGRTTYELPDFAGEHCCHMYPIVALKLTDLVSGYNALQFACDQGTSFWGHFIVDNACLRAELKPEHPDLTAAGLAGCSARVRASPSAAEPETLELVLDAPPEIVARIVSVDYEGLYRGYDENGDTRETDWHGFTKHRRRVAHLGTATKPPFAVSWDVSMLPAQQAMAVRATLHFRDHEHLIYVTPPTTGLRTPEHRDVDVTLIRSGDMPAPFWSRAGRRKTCTLELDVAPDRIERAELHVVVWDGGAGTVRDSFTFNGRPLPVAGAGRHDVIYTRLPIEPALLRRGPNTIELLSDTEHHGIEILLPGPALVVRTRK